MTLRGQFITGICLKNYFPDYFLTDPLLLMYNTDLYQNALVYFQISHQSLNKSHFVLFSNKNILC